MARAMVGRAASVKVTILHNPACGTSRKTLEILNDEGADVTVIDYLKTPPTRDELTRLMAGGAELEALQHELSQSR